MAPSGLHFVSFLVPFWPSFLNRFFDAVLLLKWRHWGAFWGHFGDILEVILGSFWVHFGFILASFWVHFGVHFCIILGSFWDHFGISLESLGSFWDYFVAILESL